MRWFIDLGIAKKLAIAFGLMIALLMLIGLFALRQKQALDGFRAEIVGHQVPVIHDVLGMKVALNEYRTAEIQQINFAADPEEVAGYEKRLEGFKATFDALFEDYRKSINLAEERPLFEAVDAAQRAYFGHHAGIAAAIASGDIERARAISGEDARITRRDLAARLDEALAFNTTLLETSNAEAEAVAARAQSLLLIAMLIAVLVGVAASWGIARLVAAPAAQAQRLADAIAQGQLDLAIPAAADDEIGRVMVAMARMRERLRDVLAEMARMAEKHAAGAMDFRMDASRFPGDYGRMVEATNGLVGDQIALNGRVVGLVAEYAEGDLRSEMEPLPGDQLRITEALQAVRRRLAAINGEIQRLADAASVGDFSQRGDESAFQHDFRRMIGALNQLMGTSDEALNEVSRVLRAMAEGDLTQRVRGRFGGVFGQIGADADASAEHIAEIIDGIQQAVDRITIAASEIASGNMDLGRRTENQAANLEETAASMEELTSTVKQNADSARQANQLAASAAEVAGRGGQQIRDVVATMDGISESSRKVGEIISVIDGIAFQTNILALNAAVEAARAGEQGRGFAVVASEVRTLAQRSAAAAKEIKDLITESIERVEGGAQRVQAAGATMDDIVTGVRRVNDIMAEISAASAEQSSGIEQVSQTVGHLDQSTQQNAALVEEASAAAKALEDQAVMLKGLAGRFRLEGSVDLSAAQAETERPI